MEPANLKEIEHDIINVFPDFNSGNHLLHQQLSEYIDYLVRNDFDKLIVSLYRFDINESKLRSLLETETNKTAGDIIASLIISRQQEKIQSRKTYKTSGNSNEERW